MNITEKPVPSLLRNFSAPVRLVSDVTNEDLYFLLAHDSDQFNRQELVIYRLCLILVYLRNTYVLIELRMPLVNV